VRAVCHARRNNITSGHLECELSVTPAGTTSFLVTWNVSCLSRPQEQRHFWSPGMRAVCHARRNNITSGHRECELSVTPTGTTSLLVIWNASCLSRPQEQHHFWSSGMRAVCHVRRNNIFVFPFWKPAISGKIGVCHRRR
jgi:hypothetical protein